MPTPASPARPKLFVSGNFGRGQIVDAERDQEDADGGPDVGRAYNFQHEDAGRNADRAAEHERQQPLVVDRISQPPCRIALHQQRICDDQRRSLDGRQRVQPDSGCNQAEGETRNAKLNNSQPG